MATLVLGPPPPELQELLDRRRRFGADRHDEVWAGVYHMVPGPSYTHSSFLIQLAEILAPIGRAAGLKMTAEFNLGESKQDFRIPDAGLHRPGAGGIWLSTAALVIEILSPEDEAWEKLPFYAAHDVDEVAVIDPRARSVDWLGLSGDQYKPLERSALVELGPAELAARIDWPPDNH